MNQACSQDFSKEGGKEYDMDPPARLSLEEENDALNIYWEALTFFYPMMGDIHQGPILAMCLEEQHFTVGMLLSIL